MDKALHQFDMPNEYKYIQIKYILVCLEQSHPLPHLIQHVTLIPQLMRQCL